MPAPELLRYREAFLQGQVKLDITEETFSLRKYNDFLRSIAPEVAEFKTRQQAAFEAERDRWQESESQVEIIDPLEVAVTGELDLPPNSQVVAAHIPANVWQIVVEKGATVAAGDRLVVLESMKMEIAITASISGIVLEILCTQGQLVAVGQNLVVIQAVEGEG